MSGWAAPERFTHPGDISVDWDFGEGEDDLEETGPWPTQPELVPMQLPRPPFPPDPPEVDT